MSNNETIVGLLKKVHERRRRNRIFKELGLALSMVLPLPVLLKLWDLWSPLRGRTVLIALGVWAVGAAAFIASRLRSTPTTLSEEAAVLDRQAGLHDEIRTAYWFTQSPRRTDWIDAQIQRAVQTAHRLNIDSLYPRVLPKVIYMAAGLAFLLAALNFLPLPGNHNWFYLDAAPAFTLSDSEKALLKQAQTLLEQAERIGEPEIVQKLQRIVQDLQQGKISREEALAKLAELKTELEAGNLDIGNVKEGLSEVAGDLGRAKTLEAAAKALAENDLATAANEIRDVANQVPDLSQQEKDALQKSLDQAAENQRAGLEKLNEDMKAAADAIKNKNDKLTKEELEQVAEQIEELLKQMQGQELKDEAADKLDSLADSLRQDGDDQAEELAKDLKDLKDLQPASKDGRNNQPGQKPAGQVPRGQGDAGGGGQNPSGEVPDAPAPREGAPTALSVQLEQEQLVEAPKDPEEKKTDEQENSKQEQSTLDYKNVTPELTSAQKDTLNQNSVPWEYRQLIKQYFQAIKPQQNK